MFNDFGAHINVVKSKLVKMGIRFILKVTLNTCSNLSLADDSEL